MAMVASGCSDGAGRAGTLPSRTATPTTTSASPTPTLTTPEAQIESTIREFFAEVNKAAQTLDTSKLQTMSSRLCPCYGYVRVFRRVKKDKLNLDGAEWNVVSVRVHHLGSNYGFAEVRYVAEPYRVVDANGKVVDQYRRFRQHVDFTLLRTARGWTIENAVDIEGKR